MLGDFTLIYYESWELAQQVQISLTVMFQQLTLGFCWSSKEPSCDKNTYCSADEVFKTILNFWMSHQPRRITRPHTGSYIARHSINHMFECEITEIQVVKVLHTFEKLLFIQKSPPEKFSPREPCKFIPVMISPLPSPMKRVKPLDFLQLFNLCHDHVFSYFLSSFYFHQKIISIQSIPVSLHKSLRAVLYLVRHP